MVCHGREVSDFEPRHHSITQGEQPGILWSFLRPLGVKIHFAHRTFKWENEAAGNAAVHCVIIGFGLSEHGPIRLWDSPGADGNCAVKVVAEINPYLVEAPFVYLTNRRDPLCQAPPMAFGSMPNDAKGLLSNLSETDRISIVQSHPAVAEAVVRPVAGAEEYINGIQRYCLWIREADLGAAQAIPQIRERVHAVRQKRQQSSREATRLLASTPYAWGEIRQPNRRYIFIPSTSSENRAYIPIGFLEPTTIATNSGLTIDGASLYDFGVLTSVMHMAWTRAVCGRMRSDYRYSVSIVYNNYPWPRPTPDQRRKIEKAAQGVLDARQPLLDAGQTFAQLYAPDFTPASLMRAHEGLNQAVDEAYGYTGLGSDSDRTAFLFKRYLELDQPLAPAVSAPRRRRRRP